MTDNILNDYNALSLQEQRAWDAFSTHSQSTIYKFSNEKSADFGQAECKLVDFEDFWLKRVQNLGWVEVMVNNEGENFIGYGFNVTNKGRTVQFALQRRNAGRKS